MDSDQPRANTSATLDPGTTLGTQTHPNTSDNPNDPSIPINNSPYEPLTPSSDSLSDSPSNTPSSSTDSLDSPSVVVSPGSSNLDSTPPDNSNSVTDLGTPPDNTSPDSYSEVKPRQYTDIKPVGPTNAIVSQSKPTIRDKAFKFNKTAVIATVAALSVIVAVGIGSLVLTSSNSNNASLTGNNKPITTTYKPQSLALGNITGYDQLLTGKNQDLKVNGQLSVANSIVLSPSTTPTNPTLGQLYYSSTTNTPYLYNGKSFISLIPSVGGTIAGASTSLSLGNGLGLQGTNLANTGVTNLSGTPNQIIASASNGSIKLSLPTNLDIAGNFTTTNGLVTNSLDAGYITGNGYGITDINPNALPSTLAYQNKNNTFTSPQAFRNSTNSTNAFSIQDAQGNTLLSADTTDDSLTVNNLLPETPGQVLSGLTINQIIADSGNDGYNDNGQWSVMGSDGFMRFVYTNWTTDTIHYVRCENTDCTTYIDQPIETDATNGLDSPTIALDQNGDPYIAYIDYTSPTNSWHIAHCSDENCSTTTIEDLSQTNANGYNGSIAVDGQDHADLVYDTYDYGSPQLFSLEFIHCENTDCSQNTDTTLASNGGSGGYETSSVVTAPDGYPRVAYVNNATDSLVFDNCSGSYDCSSYTSNVVDNGNASYWMAMAIGSDDLPKFVYEGSNSNNDALEYAACNDAACSTASLTQLVSGSNSYGGYGSIALTSNNLPVISSYNEPNGQAANLLYIYCSDADCTSPLTKTVASLGSRGYTSNIGITGNGLPMITYIYQDNSSDAAINSVTLGDITGDSIITTGTTIGSSSDPFGTIYASQIQTTGINTSSSGQLLVQGTTDSTNAFTVQDAAGNNLLNVDSLTDTTTLSSSSSASTSLSSNLLNNYFPSFWNGNNWIDNGSTETYTGSGGDELYDDGDELYDENNNYFTGYTQLTLTITISGDTGGGCITPVINNGGNNNYGTPICGDGSNLTSTIEFNANGGYTSFGFIPDSNFNGTISNPTLQQLIANPIMDVDGSIQQSPSVLSANSDYTVSINGDASSPTSDISLGPNLTPDNNFADSDWSADSNWELNNSSATYIGEGDDRLKTSQFTPVPGATYQLSFDCTGDTNNGDITVLIGDNGYNFGCSAYTIQFTTYDSNPLTFIPDGGEYFNGTISNVEVQKLYSNPTLTVQDAQDNAGADIIVANNASGETVLSVDNQGDITSNGGGSFAGNLAVGGNITSSEGGIELETANTPGIYLTTEGSPGNTNYSYTVVANLDSNGGVPASYSSANTTTGNSVLSATNYNQITWNSVGGAQSYSIYRTASGGTPSNTGLIGTTNSITSTFDDTGISANTNQQAPNSNSSSDTNAVLYSPGTLVLQADTDSGNNNYIKINQVTNSTTIGNEYENYAFAPNVQNGDIFNDFNYNSDGSGNVISDSVYLASFTMTNATNGQLTPVLQLSTSGKLLFGSASDTALFRSAAGSLAVEGTSASTTAFEVEDPSGLAVVSIDTKDMQINVNGHYVSGNAPGTSGTTVTNGAQATCTLTGNDTSGVLQIVTSSTPSNGTQCTINFASQYVNSSQTPTTPNPVISPRTSNAVGLFYTGNVSSSSFTVDTPATPSSSTTYKLDYWNAQ